MARVARVKGDAVVGERVIVFGATAEGNKIASMLAEGGIPTRLCIAADCGEELAGPCESLKITTKRMESFEMTELIRQSGCELVIDAAHPFAAEMRSNLRAACGMAGVELIRLAREKSVPDNVIQVDTAQQAAAILGRTAGKVLLTVGSRELGAFIKVRGYQTRLFARVLPTVETLKKCLSLGFLSSHLICMQGPFTHEINAATIRMLGVSYMVTKDSGYAEGLFEKLSAARETGCKLILIRRADEPEQGLNYGEVIALLSEKFRIKQIYEAKTAEAGVPFQPHFPIFANLKDRRITIVGGGNTAFKRAKTLIKFGAEVRIIAPEISAETAGLVREGKILWLKIEFVPQLLEGSDLVVAATNVREVNRAVSEAAKKMQMLVNIADSREESTFLFPTVIQSDSIVTGIVTTDSNYAAVKKAAKRLRAKLFDGRL